MMPQFFACLTSHPLYIPSSFAVETLQLVRNLLRVDWQISPPNSSAIPLIDVDGEKIKPKTKAMKFSAALRDGNARHKKFSSLKVSIKSSTCITDHQISFHVGLYKMQKFSHYLLPLCISYWLWLPAAFAELDFVERDSFVFCWDLSH